MLNMRFNDQHQSYEGGQCYDVTSYYSLTLANVSAKNVRRNGARYIGTHL